MADDRFALRRDTARAMSQENVEVARKAFDCFNRRDLATAEAAFHTDAVWIPYLAALEEASYSGRDQIVAMWRDIIREVPDLRLELIAVVRDQADAIVIEVELQGSGRASGAGIRATVFQVAWFRDGKVARVEGFRDRVEALEALATGG
jgi:ketosteroid isomerase-like protein